MRLRLATACLLLPAAVLAQAPASPPASAPAPAVLRLERVKDFGRGVDWAAVFKDYESRRSYKDLVQLPDGRFVITDTKTYNFLIFGPDGRFLEKLWKRGRREPSALTIYNRPSWLSLWEGRLLFVSELGRVRLFDLKGRQVREGVVDHPVECLVPLGESKVAVAGYVDRTDAPILNVIALVDLETGRETVLRDMAEPVPRPTKTADGKTVYAQAPSARIRPFVRALGGGEFAAGFSNWPEIEIFDAAGALKRSIRIRAPQPPSVVFSSKSKDGKVTMYGSNLNETPPSAEKRLAVVLPKEPGVYYFNLAVDRQGRILVFSFPEEGRAPVLRVYSNAGELVREAKVETGEYRISFSPGEEGPVFDGEFLVTLAEEEGAAGVPLRLMKFRLAGLE